MTKTIVINGDRVSGDGSTTEFRDAIDLMCEAVYQNVLAHGFYDDPPRPLERVALIHEELGELSSAIRKPGPSEHIPDFSREEEEAADDMIRIMDMARYWNIRLADAILAKHEFNKSRPYKHGKTC
jgi:NTP pyrophosphatase (non-canonical NTP hydrolase)